MGNTQKKKKTKSRNLKNPGTALLPGMPNSHPVLQGRMQ